MPKNAKQPKPNSGASVSNLYVRSTDGNNADNGTTWALAKATLAGADAIDAAGDTIYVSQAHAESTVGSLTFNLAGTSASPTKVIGGNDGAEPPTALSTAPTVTANTSGGAITVNGNVYCYGLTFIAGTSSGNPVVALGGSSAVQRYESCNFQLAGTGGSGVIRPNAGQLSAVFWKNCNVKFAAAGQGLNVNGGYFNWNGGGFVAGGTNPTTLFSAYNVGAAAGSGVNVLVENVDFTNMGTGVDLTTPPSAGVVVTFRNCKLPAAWSGSLVHTGFTSGAQGRAQMFNCDNGATNYKVWIEDGLGSIRDESTIIRTGGAFDGTNSLSWKMVSGSVVAYPSAALYSPEFQIWNDNTAGAITVTARIIHDSVTNLKDNEVWIEVSYPGSTLTPVGTLITDQPTDVLTAAADQASDSLGSSWVTTGLTNPNLQKLSVQFTAQAKGPIIARVALAKASKTIYVDAMITAA